MHISEMLLVCIQGLGEGVVMPSMNSLVANAVPLNLKATALGLIFLGFNSGG